MKPVARLAVAAVIVIVGAGVAAYGSTTRWFTVTQKGRTVDVPDFGSVPFGDESYIAQGGDVAPALPGIALLVLLASLLLLLVGRRARAGVLAVVLAGSALLVVLAVAVGASDALQAACRASQRFVCGTDVFEQQVRRGPGMAVTIGGAAIAIAGALAALPVAGKVNTLRMPETSTTKRG